MAATGVASIHRDTKRFWCAKKTDICNHEAKFKTKRKQKTYNNEKSENGFRVCVGSLVGSSSSWTKE